MRSQPWASRSLRIFFTRVSISARLPSSNPMTLTRTRWRPRRSSAISGSLFSARRATMEIRLLVMWTSTNSPPEVGGENLPKSTKPGGVFSAWIPRPTKAASVRAERSEEHTSELQSQSNLVCRLLLEKKKKEKPQTAPVRCPLTHCDKGPLLVETTLPHVFLLLS